MSLKQEREEDRIVRRELAMRHRAEMERFRGVPAKELSTIFRDHSCWKCRDGGKPCVAGRPGSCGFPHARND